MIIEVKKLIENKEAKAIDDLINHFNKEAQKQNSKYFIRMEYNYPHLTKSWFIFETYSNQIVFIEDDFNDSGYFCFVKPLNLKIFKEIKAILEAIPEKFEIKLEEN